MSVSRWPSPERDSKAKVSHSPLFDNVWQFPSLPPPLPPLPFSPQQLNADQSHKACIEAHLREILELIANLGWFSYCHVYCPSPLWVFCLGGEVSSEGLRALEFLFHSTKDRRHLLPLSITIQSSEICKVVCTLISIVVVFAMGII